MPSSRSLVLQAAAAVVLTLGLIWAATQWAAAMLGHQPALGAPWISLAGVTVYAPWKLFAWWIAFDVSVLSARTQGVPLRFSITVPVSGASTIACL